MLSNLTGWHALVILAVLGGIALVVLAIVFLVVRVFRRRAGDPSTRLRELGRLRDQGLLSEAEYAAKRQEILGQL